MTENKCKECKYCNKKAFYSGKWYCNSPKVSIFSLPPDLNECFEEMRKGENEYKEKKMKNASQSISEQEAIDCLEHLFSDASNEDYPFTEDFGKAVTKAIEALRELKEYKSIGTLEECKTAIEKQKAKKPIMEKWSPARCPCCNGELSESIGDGYYQHYSSLDFCYCGQKLDWSGVYW